MPAERALRNGPIRADSRKLACPTGTWSYALLHCPPKGDPKRGIRQKQQQHITFTTLNTISFPDPHFGDGELLKT